MTAGTMGRSPLRGRWILTASGAERFDLPGTSTTSSDEELKASVAKSKAFSSQGHPWVSFAAAEPRNTPETRMRADARVVKMPMRIGLMKQEQLTWLRS